MDDPPAPLRERLLTPLWTESEAYRSWRRCRLAITLPSAGLAGAVWGALSAIEMGVSEPVLWTVLATIAFVLLLYLEERLLPLVGEGARRLGMEALGTRLWQMGFVGLVVFMVVGVLGAPTVPAVATATVLGGVYAWLMERVFCGSFVPELAEIFVPVRRSGAPVVSDHSYAASLAARGELEAAEETYRQAIEAAPGEPIPYFPLARLLRAQQGRADEAVQLLRRALEAADLDERGATHAVRTIQEICREDLGDPSKAAPDLARLAEAMPDTEAGRWARDSLADLKAEMGRRLPARQGEDEGRMERPGSDA